MFFFVSSKHFSRQGLSSLCIEQCTCCTVLPKNMVLLINFILLNVLFEKITSQGCFTLSIVRFVCILIQEPLGFWQRRAGYNITESNKADQSMKGCFHEAERCAVKCIESSRRKFLKAISRKIKCLACFLVLSS